MSAIDDLPPLRDVIRGTALSARKSLGQNFLLDLNLTARIARAAGPLEGATVIEIGPGPGGLTRALLAQGARRVIAIERDERALAALGEIAARYPGRLEIVADALAFDPRPLLGGDRAKIVANLPYNIATALLMGWLSTEPWPPWYDMMVLMFQREVAERIVAQETTRPMAGWRCSPTGAPRRKSCSTCRRRLRAAAQGDLVGGAADAARRAGALRPPGARTGHRRRLRPAPQDAAAEPQIAVGRSGAAGRGRRCRCHPARRDHSGRRLCCHGPRIVQYTKRTKSNAP